MGEARRRGTSDERRAEAIKRDKANLAQTIGGMDERLTRTLKAGIAPFLTRLSTSEWRTRRETVLRSLKTVTAGTELAEARPIRVQADEIAWYLFLCEQALSDPLCTDVSQASRAIPFFAAIGERWDFSNKVRGLDRKIDELLHERRAEPDGLIFEVLTALSYAASGWEVQLLEERPPLKSPDMVARRDMKEVYIECKRQSRTASYSQEERNEFLRLWDSAKHLLLENGQWVWMKGAFHVEASSLPEDFLARLLTKKLPIGDGETTLHHAPDATIVARQIDRQAVFRHLKQFRVKMNSPALSVLLGGDWAPLNSAVTMAHLIKTSHVVDCETPVLGTYIDEIGWACGFTRSFDAEISIEKKSRDVKSLLSDAVKQVPYDKPSIIHIAVETLDGTDVERRRTEKIGQSIPSFITSKPVLGVRIHRFNSNQTVDKLFELDETVEKFQRDGVTLEDIPAYVVLPLDVQLIHGAHWELYP